MVTAPSGEPNDQCCFQLISNLQEQARRWEPFTIRFKGPPLSHHELARAVGIDVYFADPHSPWQRPTNANGNGLLRRYFPKGTNLAIHTPADPAVVENRINTMPRRCLNWSTAATVYAAAVAMTG